MSEAKTPLIRSICVDTLTGIQSNQYMAETKKPGHDQWKDYGTNIYNFMGILQDLGFDLILILGEPGTGKSTGMRNLPSKTNIWFNADNKNPVWIGGKAEYGKKNFPIDPYHVVPKSYQDIIDHIQGGLDNDMFEQERYAFITGHIEHYKAANVTKSRLKVLGKMATKMQLEGKLETVLYSEVVQDGAKVNYVLHTQNDGYNTARSPQGVFEPIIDNDYNLVLNGLLDY